MKDFKQPRLITILSLDRSIGICLYLNLIDAFNHNGREEYFDVFAAAQIIKSAARSSESLNFDIDGGFTAYTGSRNSTSPIWITSSEV